MGHHPQMRISARCSAWSAGGAPGLAGKPQCLDLCSLQCLLVLQESVLPRCHCRVSQGISCRVTAQTQHSLHFLALWTGAFSFTVELCASSYDILTSFWSLTWRKYTFTIPDITLEIFWSGEGSDSSVRRGDKSENVLVQKDFVSSCCACVIPVPIWIP